MAPTAVDRVWSIVERISRHEFLIMLAWSLWLAFPYFGFGHQSYVRLHDCGDCELPLAIMDGSWLAHFKSWLWNPLPITGVDSLFSVRPALQLDGLSFAVLPAWLGYGFVMWIQRFVAGYFTFRLTKDALQVSQASALFAGLAYAPFHQGWINASWAGFTLYDLLLLPGVPFILWALSRMDSQRVASLALAFGLGALFYTCAYYPYTVFFFPLLGYWFLVVTPRKDIRFWIMVVFFGAGYVLMNVPVLWATYLYAPLSHRAQWTPLGEDAFVSQASAIKTFVWTMVGLLRDNAVPLILLLTGISVKRRLPKSTVPLLVISGCIVALQGAWLVLLPLVKDRLGFLVGFNFSRFSLYLPFFLAVCGALGADGIEKSYRLGILKGKATQQSWELKSLLIFLAVGALILRSLAVQGQMVMDAAEGDNFANYYEHRAFEFLAAKKNDDRPFRVATVVENPGNCPHPAFAWGYDLESVDGYLNIYSRRYQEYWGEVVAPLTNARPRIRSYFWSWGCRVYLFSPDYFSSGTRQVSDTRALRFSDWYNLNLLALANAKYIVSPIPLHDSDLRLILTPTEEQIAWKESSKLAKLKRFLAGSQPGFALYVYENLTVLPRFRLMGNSLVFPNKQDLLGALARADYATLTSNAFILESDVQGVPLENLRNEKGDVLVRDYSFDKISLATRCDSASILVAANNWSPYWRAWVDGVETRVFPLNHTFQGVYCPPGSHDVVLRYVPPFSLQANF